MTIGFHGCVPLDRYLTLLRKTDTAVETIVKSIVLIVASATVSAKNPGLYFRNKNYYVHHFQIGCRLRCAELDKHALCHIDTASHAAGDRCQEKSEKVSGNGVRHLICRPSSCVSSYRMEPGAGHHLIDLMHGQLLWPLAGINLKKYVN